MDSFWNSIKQIDKQRYTCDTTGVMLIVGGYMFLFE